MPFRYKGINHIALVTNDMERTVRFWRDLLGMRLIIAMGRRGYRQYFFELDQHNMILFFEWDGVEKIPAKDHGVPVKGPFAFDHLAIGVEDLSTLYEIKDRLDAAGFWVSEVIDHGFVYSLYSFDPNDIPIEFCVAAQDVDVRKNPVLKDRHPLDVTQEGSEPKKGIWPEPKTFTQKGEWHMYPGEGREYIGNKR